MDTTISMESLEKFEKNFDANRANAMAARRRAEYAASTGPQTTPPAAPP